MYRVKRFSQQKHYSFLDTLSKGLGYDTQMIQENQERRNRLDTALKQASEDYQKSEKSPVFLKKLESSGFYSEISKNIFSNHNFFYDSKEITDPNVYYFIPCRPTIYKNGYHKIMMLNNNPNMGGDILWDMSRDEYKITTSDGNIIPLTKKVLLDFLKKNYSIPGMKSITDFQCNIVKNLKSII